MTIPYSICSAERERNDIQARIASKRVGGSLVSELTLRYASFGEGRVEESEGRVEGVYAVVLYNF
jgi:hypothetical protein